jgi:NADH dehydrogenase
MDMGPLSSDIKVLVLGGSGFIGRHAVAALLQRGAQVIIGTRNPDRMSGRIPEVAGDCERREIRLESLVDVEHWPDLIDDVDTVLNCVGILRQRGASSYDRVHHLAPEALAATCAALGKRLVHVSALGLHADARSRFLTSKLAGEHRIRMSGADWVLVRPSLIDGEDGFGARWIRGIAKLPFYAAPMDAGGRIAALDADDLGEALARLCLDSATELDLGRSRVFELGGTEALVFRDYVTGMRRNYTAAPHLRIPVPGLLARLFAHLCDVFHVTPFSFGHYELLKRDNVPEPNRLPELLGRQPIAVAPRASQAAPNS